MTAAQEPGPILWWGSLEGPELPLAMARLGGAVAVPEPCLGGACAGAEGELARSRADLVAEGVAVGGKLGELRPALVVWERGERMRPGPADLQAFRSLGAPVVVRLCPERERAAGPGADLGEDLLGAELVVGASADFEAVLAVDPEERCTLGGLARRAVARGARAALVWDRELGGAVHFDGLRVQSVGVEWAAPRVQGIALAAAFAVALWEGQRPRVALRFAAAAAARAAGGELPRRGELALAPQRSGPVDQPEAALPIGRSEPPVPIEPGEDRGLG